MYKKSALILSFALCLLVIIIILPATPKGFNFVIRTIGLFLPGKISVKNIEGNFYKEFSVQSFQYKHKNYALTLDNIHLKWKLFPLQRKIIIEDLAVNDLFYTVINPSKPKNFNKILQDIQNLQVPNIFRPLPLNIYVNRLIIKNIMHINSNHNNQITNLSFSGDFIFKGWNTRNLSFNYLNSQFLLDGFWQFISPFQGSYNLIVKPINQDSSYIRGMVHILRDQENYSWNGNFTQPQLTISGSLKNQTNLTGLATWKDLVFFSQDQKIKSDSGKIELFGTLPDFKALADISLSDPSAAIITAAVKKDKQNFLVNTVLKTSSGSELSADLIIEKFKQMKFTLHPGKFVLAENHHLSFVGGSLLGNFKYDDFNLNGSIAIDAAKKINLSLCLPKLLKSTYKNDQIINAAIKTEVSSLESLKNAFTRLNKINGSLEGAIFIKGFVNKPKITGHIKINNGEVFYQPLGLTFTPINLTFTTNANNWQLDTSIYANKVPLKITGSGDLLSKKGRLNITGYDFPIMDTKAYKFNVSPNIMVKILPSGTDITGSILIPTATISPQTFSSTIVLTDDVRFTEKKSQTFLPYNLDLQLQTGKNVKLDIQGLQGYLTGTVKLEQQQNGPLNAIGAVNISKGSYKAYGQALNIDQGQLFFPGGSILNPNIILRATKRFNNTSVFHASERLFDFNTSNLVNLNFAGKTTVGIEISGQFNHLKTKLFSMPPTLSQADILSMLILGRPANQASTAGGQLLLNALAASNLSPDDNSTIFKQLKSIFNFDFDYQANTKFNPNTNQISTKPGFKFGKSLSKRLYIGYELSLSSNDVDVFTLTYLLNKFLRIQVSSSVSGSGIDLLYTRQKN